MVRHKSSLDDTGPKCRPEFPHARRQVRCDGAKDVETILQIVGEEPATSTRAQAQ